MLQQVDMKEGVHFETFTPGSVDVSPVRNGDSDVTKGDGGAATTTGPAAAAATAVKNKVRTAQSMRSFFNRVVNQINLTRRVKRGREEVSHLSCVI